MKKLLLILLVLMPAVLFAPTPHRAFLVALSPIERYYPMFTAVATVETQGNAFKVNILEGAYGILQIRQCMLNDYNRITKSNYSLRDCFSVPVSRRIFYWHCCRYRDIETAARRWNGRGRQTDIYWQKIKQAL
jgi:hypothetical protein